jgi:hypothetical protein
MPLLGRCACCSAAPLLQPLHLLLQLQVGILRKTWGKMGEGGRAAALALPLGPEEAALVGKALAG